MVSPFLFQHLLCFDGKWVSTRLVSGLVKGHHFHTGLGKSSTALIQPIFSRSSGAGGRQIS